MGNQKTKSEKSKTNSDHVLNTYPISNANTYSNPNANTNPNPNLNRRKPSPASQPSAMEDQEKCQKCGSTEFIPVCYGYPTGKAMEKYKRGELILAGCCVLGEKPSRVCKICNKYRIHNDKDDDEEDDWD